jgi:hypothetical protein
MAKVTLDVGPVAAQALTVGQVAVNNIGVTIQDRPGPVKLHASLVVNNPAASTPTVTAGIRKNGVQVVSTARTMVMVASTRISIEIDHFDPAAVVGDVFALDIQTSAAVAAHELTANGTSLLVEAVSQDAALCAGIGPVTV